MFLIKSHYDHSAVAGPRRSVYSCVYSLGRYGSGTFLRAWLCDNIKPSIVVTTRCTRKKLARGPFDLKTNGVIKWSADEVVRQRMRWLLV